MESQESLLIKHGREMFQRVLHKLFTALGEKGEVPHDWKRSRVTLRHKGASTAKEESGHYRPISFKYFSQGFWNERERITENMGRGCTVQNQDCSYYTGEREDIEHLIVYCREYEEARRRRVGSGVEIIGGEERSNR